MAIIPVARSSLSLPGIIRSVTPHATNDLPDGPCRCLWINVAGNLTFIPADDADAVTLTVPAGRFDFPVKAVRASGTTATGIFACY